MNKWKFKKKQGTKWRKLFMWLLWIERIVESHLQMRAINAPMRKRNLIHVEGTKRGKKKLTYNSTGRRLILDMIEWWRRIHVADTDFSIEYFSLTPKRISSIWRSLVQTYYDKFCSFLSFLLNSVVSEFKLLPCTWTSSRSPSIPIELFQFIKNWFRETFSSYELFFTNYVKLHICQSKCSNEISISIILFLLVS